MVAAVTVRNLRVVRRRTPVLDGLSLAFEEGRVTGLLGPSGAGKTTLIRALVGVQRVTSGDVRVLGEPAGAPALRSRVGYVTQAPAVYDDLTVAENLAYFGRVLDAGPAEVGAAIDAVDLDEHVDQLARDLSGGERARLSLATAMLNAPDLLVLDEPTVGLDPVLRRDLWDLFHQLAGGGTTVIVSSHVMDEAARCDALVLLRGGAVLYDGSPQGLRERTGCDDLNDAFLAIIEAAS